MDKNTLVDNKPGVKLDVEIAGKKGSIWLSSIYGSYNFVCNIDTPKDEIVKNYCPHCHEEIIAKFDCEVCQAPMSSFYLQMGGKVSICTRIGCKNHSIEFEDLSLALKRLYEEHGFSANKYDHRPKRPVKTEKAKQEEKKEEEKKEIIETGAFLQAYCPFCEKSLIEDDMLKLKIINGEEGILLLSPYLNVFTSRSTIFLPENKAVSDFKCFHCNESLIAKDKKCDACGSPVARIRIIARTKLIDFYICSKKGCRWHGLSEDDLNDIRLEDSLEW